MIDIEQINDSKYLSLAEAAKIKKVSSDYLRFLIFKKQLNGVKSGRNWVTTIAWMDEYFSQPDERKIKKDKEINDSIEIASSSKIYTPRNDGVEVIANEHRECDNLEINDPVRNQILKESAVMQAEQISNGVKGAERENTNGVSIDSVMFSETEALRRMVGWNESKLQVTSYKLQVRKPLSFKSFQKAAVGFMVGFAVFGFSVFAKEFIYDQKDEIFESLKNSSITAQNKIAEGAENFSESAAEIFSNNFSTIQKVRRLSLDELTYIFSNIKSSPSKLVKTISQEFSSVFSSASSEATHLFSSIIARSFDTIETTKQSLRDSFASLGMTESFQKPTSFWSFLGNQLKTATDKTTNTIISVFTPEQNPKSLPDRQAGKFQIPSLASEPLEAKLEADKEEVREIATSRQVGTRDDNGVETSLRGVATTKQSQPPTKEIATPAARNDYQIRSELLSSLEQFNQKIRSEVSASLQDFKQQLSNISTTANRTETKVIVQERTIALTNRIDNLNSINITNGATLTSGDLVLSKGNITVSEGGLTLQSGNLTLSSGSFSLTGNTTIGDSQSDTLTIHPGTVTYINSSTTTIPSATKNAYSIATSTSVTPFLTFNTDAYRIGIGTTTPGRTLSIQGDLLVSGTANLATLNMSSLTITGTLDITSTTATSTLSTGGLTIGTNQLVIQQNSGYVGIATSSPYSLFSIESGTETSSMWIGNQGSTTPSFTINGVNGDGRVGIGTSSPAQLLSVAGNGYFTGGLGVGISTTSAGTLELTGNALFGDASTDSIYYRVGQMAFTNSATTTLPSAVNAYSFATTIGATPLLSFDTTNTRIGVGTSSPYSLFSIEQGTENYSFSIGNEGSTTPSFIVNGVNQDGRIGIGTSTPRARLAINHSSNSPSFLITNTGSNFTAYIEDSADDVSPTVIDASGSWGIGTTSPGALLSVHGGNILTSATSSSAGLVATGTVLLATTGTNFVGIGSSTPWGQLSINPSGISGPSFTIGSSTKTDLIVTNGGYMGVGTTSPYAMFSIEQNSTATDLFVVGDQGTSTPLFVVKGSGNVGVGTAGAAVSNLHISRVTTSAIRGTFPAQGETATDGWLVGYISGEDYFRIINYEPGTDMRFLTTPAAGSATERMVIYRDGNVGIGTATPAGGLLDIGPGGTGNGDIVLNINSGSGTGRPYLQLQRNSVNKATIGLSASAGGLIAGSVADDLIMKSNSSNSILFSTDNGTTAHMTILASTGNVGIGTTSPRNQLQIEGSTDGQGLLISRSGTGASFISLVGNRTADSEDLGGIRFFNGGF
ncbi:MAG: hypothetical protein Q8R29_03900, partial [bacterium]|nr:hypothetical protein [bacterium]